jgi:hypothetical protein
VSRIMNPLRFQTPSNGSTNPRDQRL